MSPRPDSLPPATPAGVEVLTRILTEGPIPRVEIARRTGLSQAAVTKAVTPLVETGFVADRPTPPVDNQLAIGRPVSPLGVVADRVAVIGLKVTPTDLIGVTTDFRAGIHTVRHAPLTSTQPETVLRSLADLARALVAELATTQQTVAAASTAKPVRTADRSSTAAGIVRKAVRTTGRSSVAAGGASVAADTAGKAVRTTVRSSAASVSTAAAGPLIGIGVAVSGDVDSRNGVVRDSPLMGWHDVRVADLLGAELPVPVLVTNDVHALTVAEHWFGVGVNADSFAVVTIGSGVGCGLYVNGEVVSGAHGVSGELGHLPLAPGDLVCTCGRRGCVETVASSDAILARVRASTGRPELELAGAIELAHAGDGRAREAFDRAGEVIGSALAAMVNLVGPELVVIAGEGVADYDLYEQRMRQAFADHAFGAAGECRLTLRSHTFDDWARGAAATVIRAYVRGEQPFPR